MAWNDFVPQRQGRDSRVATIVGPHGLFQIAFAGADRDGGTSYFYQDERGRFGFLVEEHLVGEIRFDVKLATARGPESALAFKTSEDNEAIFRSNIDFFFKTRNWILPWRSLGASSATITVVFSWKLLQSRSATTDSAAVQIKTRELKSTQIEGPGGRFDIAFAGSDPHGWHCYYYEDKRDSIWFMALLSFEPAPTWDVARATITPWGQVGNHKTSSDNEVIF
jgi:hypothetical protein